MPFYDARTVYTDPILTNFSIGFQDQNLIGAELFPFNIVSLPSGRYRVFDRSNWLVWPDRRDPGTQTPRVRSGKWSEDTFSTREHALAAEVTDEERQFVAASNAIGVGAQNQAMSGLAPERDAVATITRSVLLGHELQVSTTARNAALYAGGHTVTLAGANQWSDASGGDPIGALKTGMSAIYNDIYTWPNLMIIPWPVVLSLMNNPKILGYFTTAAQLPVYDWEQAVRLFTGFAGRIVIANQFYNNVESQEMSANMTSIWGKDVILAYVNEGGGQGFTFGKTFALNQPSGGLRVVDRWREEDRKVDVFRCSMYYDLKIVSSLAGYLIKNAIA